MKHIDDVLSSPYERDYVTVPSSKEVLPTFETTAEFNAHIVSLEQDMRQAAANLEFERAAGLRDQIKQLRNHELGLGNRV